MLARHKAEVEIARLMLIVPEAMPNHPRMLKRKAMKLELGMIAPADFVSIAPSEKVLGETE